MIGALIIVFREVIEAGLIIGIVLAATQSIPGSRKWVFGGVIAGILGSCIVAGFTSALTQMFEGFGQELLNAAILATAVVMLTWHNVWMSRHGRALVDELKQAGRDVLEGKKPLLALAIVVGAAVLREGAEVVMFLYGIAVSDGGPVANLIGGALAGLALGGFVSGLTYLGLLRIPTRHLFAVTSWLIAFLAAGMAAQAAGFLEQAGVVEILGNTLWDSSAWLSDRSVAGRILHTLVGYSDQPTALQFVVYLVTLAAIFLLMKFASPPIKPSSGVSSRARQTV